MRHKISLTFFQAFVHNSSMTRRTYFHGNRCCKKSLILPMCHIIFYQLQSSDRSQMKATKIQGTFYGRNGFLKCALALVFEKLVA